MEKFLTIKKAVRAQYDKFLKSGNPLFQTNVDRDKIWEAYIDGFSEDERQRHVCSCCKSFIRRAGGMVMIDSDYQLHTLWDNLKDLDSCYISSAEALAEYVASVDIVHDFKEESGQRRIGTDKSPDMALGVVWQHFYIDLPNRLLGAPDYSLKSVEQVFRRGLCEIEQGAIDTVLELIGQNSIYRGEQFKSQVEKFAKHKLAFADLNGTDLESLEREQNYIWRTVATERQEVTKIRNTSIGQLLQDLSEGKGLEQAVRSFEAMVAPANYQRPTALVTPRMIEKAKTRLNELGLISALDRRILDTRDLSVADAIFTHRVSQKTQDVFAEMAGEAVVDLQKLSKVEEVHVDKFVKDILPMARSINVLFERQHLGNLVTLTGAVEEAPKNLFHWDNSYGWSYSGGVADSIKERVKTAGGKVDGWGRFSLAWYNYDDLDIHFQQVGGEKVYYSNKKGKLAQLDVDMNAGSGETRDAVENIYIPRQLPKGDYEVIVHNFAKRETRDTGFEIEIDINGKLQHLSSAVSPKGGKTSDKIEFSVDANGNVKFKKNGFSSSSTGTTKWGLNTGVWHQVNAITTSPNHWTKPTGNKHLFFLLNGCVSDETTRPFYNEFLTQELVDERKVMEVLGSKVQVASAEGVELSGLGFSETIRNHMFVEVEGSFKRTLKINF